MPDNHVLRLGAYLALARDLSSLLVPVRPRSEFRKTLEESLVLAARQSYTLQSLKIAAPMAALPAQVVADRRGLVLVGRDRRWVVSAAAVGSAVSIAGIFAYLWYQRGQRAA